MTARMSAGRVAAVAFGVLAAIGAVALVIRLGNALPTGPLPVAWDEEACAECRMHVGEPAFAAQLQTTRGEVLNFDDPGCALRYVARERPPIHALYFHAHTEDTWLAQGQTAFVRASPSPMGYGLAAVRVGTPGALTMAEALEQASRTEPHAVTP